MRRRLYVFAMKLMRKHVLADDCWCKPRIEHVAAQPFLSSGPDEDVTGFSSAYVRRHA